MSAAARHLLALAFALWTVAATCPGRAAACGELRVPSASATFEGDAGLPVSAGEDGRTAAVWLWREPTGTTVRVARCAPSQRWSAPRDVATSSRSLAAVRLRALRVTSTTTALLWDEQPRGEDPARLHLATTGADGRWADRVLDVLPAGWQIEAADLTVLSDGRPLAVWHAAPTESAHTPGILWSAVPERPGAAPQRAAFPLRLDGQRARPVGRLVLRSDRAGGAWLISTSGEFDSQTLSWSRWLPTAGWQPRLSPDDASGPEISWEDGLGPLALGQDGSPRVVVGGRIVALADDGTSSASPEIPEVRGRDLTPWVGNGDAPSASSLAVDRRGAEVIGASVPLWNTSIGLEVVGWTATAAPWAFRRAAGGRWRTELIDPLAGDPFSVPVTLSPDARGRLRALWTLPAVRGRGCETMVMMASESSRRPGWTPRSLVSTVRAPRCERAEFTVTGGRSSMVAVGGRGLTVVPQPGARPDRPARATFELLTARWAAVRRGGHIAVRCRAARSAICSVEARPVLPAPLPDDVSLRASEVGECLDGRVARAVGRPQSVVARLPADCDSEPLERVRQLDVHIVVDEPGKLPLERVQRVAMRP